jgi:hypothetical protein
MQWEKKALTERSTAAAAEKSTMKIFTFSLASIDDAEVYTR